MSKEKADLVSRRRFLRGLSFAAAGLVTAHCAPAPTSTPEEAGATAVPPTSTPTEVPPTSTPTEVPPTATPAGPKMGGTLRYAATGDYNSFNPWRVQGVNGAMYNQVFSKLMFIDENGEIHADIAEDWDLSSDGLSFTVKMRENVKWHDGQECVAKDFVTMYEYAKDEELSADANIKKFAALVGPVTGVEAVDKFTIRFDFDAPAPFIIDILDYWQAVRIDDKSDPGMLKALPIGTGPFKMVEWVPKQYSRFVRNEDYHLEGQPYLDEFIWTRLDSEETLLPNLQSGTVDGYQVASQADMRMLDDDPNYWVHWRPVNGAFNILVNCRLPPFDQKEVRQALSYSLNREQYWQTAYFRNGYPVVATFHMPTSLGYREDLVMAHPFDLDRAAQLLEGAGVSNLEFDINVSPYHASDKIWALIWKDDLAKIGITLNVKEVETAEWYDIEGDDNLKGNGIHPWGTGRANRDPHIFLSTQWPYRPYDHPLGWSNQEMTDLMARGARELDTEERRKIYQRCNEILIEESPTINLVASANASAYLPYVKGVYYDLHGFMHFKEAWLDT